MIFVTPGDPDGIGPEILTRLLLKKPSLLQEICAIGSLEALEKTGTRCLPITESHLEAPANGRLKVLPAPTHAPPNALLAGYQSGWSVQKAVRLLLKRKGQALVTGPIHKARLQKGGYPYAGHTELLAASCRKRSATMMLANSQMRVSLVTVHTPLCRVSRELTRNRLHQTLQHTASFLSDILNIQQPRLAVLGLNPHAGEEGRLGREEVDIIRPVIAAWNKNRSDLAQLEGPFPSDTFFALHSKRYDAVIAMYHDQGLIPVKLLDFKRTVNLTLGLPIIRTSVDHGTAFDLVGKGLADPSSLEAAIELAQEICQKRV